MRCVGTRLRHRQPLQLKPTGTSMTKEQMDRTLANHKAKREQAELSRMDAELSASNFIIILLTVAVWILW